MAWALLFLGFCKPVQIIAVGILGGLTFTIINFIIRITFKKVKVIGIFLMFFIIIFVWYTSLVSMANFNKN